MALYFEDKTTTIRNIWQTMSALKKIKSPINSSISAQLMGYEGNMARAYWSGVSKALPEGWQMAGRSRQPARDGFNAVLNYLYGMLYPVVESALFAAGLDPYLGILHTDQYDAPTLAFDCIEPFRPWVDALIVEQFITHQVRTDMFRTDETDGGIYLSSVGKRFWIPLFNNFLSQNVYFANRRLTRKTHINRYAGELANRLKNLNI